VRSDQLVSDEELIHMRTDEVLQKDRAPVADLHHSGQDLRHLDACEEALAALWIEQLHREREAEAADVGEGVPGVNGERCQDGEDLLPEARRELSLRGWVDLFPAHDREAVAAKLGRQVGPGRLCCVHQEGGRRLNGLHLLGWRASVRAGGLDPRVDLFANRGHTDAEEFVDVRCDDAEELETVQERVACILCLMKDAGVEGKGGEFTTDDVAQREFGGLRHVGHRCRPNMRSCFAAVSMCSNRCGVRLPSRCRVRSSQ